jgi:hypothetical protein
LLPTRRSIPDIAPTVTRIAPAARAPLQALLNYSMLVLGAGPARRLVRLSLSIQPGKTAAGAITAVGPYISEFQCPIARHNGHIAATIYLPLRLAWNRDFLGMAGFEPGPATQPPGMS